jgi:hypothetical protein
MYTTENTNLNPITPSRAKSFRWSIALLGPGGFFVPDGVFNCDIPQIIKIFKQAQNGKR